MPDLAESTADIAAMYPLLISLCAFLAIFGGALAGVWLANRLPEPHLTNETRTAVSVSMAVVGPLAALVLSLMITNASTSFSARKGAIENLAVNIIRLDRALMRYGEQSAPVRATLRTYADAKARELSRRSSTGLELQNLRLLESLSDQILAFKIADDRERQIEFQALKLVDAMSEARWLLAKKTDIAVPPAFLVLLIFWLSLLFASFGLFAPKNATVIVILLLCAIAISGGVFMILELGSSTRGLVRPSVEPMNIAISEIGASD